MRPEAGHEQGSGIPLNQNRNQNRRRGRGNNRGGQGGGQGNRIDSRARGNAPQMLEKYKKLAHDASLNGDRVLTEYYLQFADHYFRVVADSRQQRDDGRPAPRPHDRDHPFGTDDYESEEREESGRDEAPRGEQPRPRRDRYDEERPVAEEGQRASEGEQVDEAVAEENPFIREARPPRERSAARTGERSTARARGRARPANDTPEDADEGTFDAAVLPPSIARDPRDEEAAEAPRPARGRGRRARPVDDEGDEALEAVR
jgi:hypothetical protein